MNSYSLQKWYHSVFLTALIAFSFQPVMADLVISEFLASNSGASIVDEDGDDSDWIELRNTGNTSVALLNYSLTDDATDLGQWKFPNVSIPANGYLVIFASSKNRTPVSGELHTNFKLGAGGEYLALVDPAGDVVDSFDPGFPAQTEDVAYGLSDDQTTLGFFNSPTPGSANSAVSGGSVADTKFSLPRGIYTSAISLEITTATVGATIRYTSDGSTPTLTSGTIYTGPISITGTTVIRALAYKTGFTETNVDTQSYLFPADIVTQNSNGSAPAGWPTGSANGQVYDYGMDPDITGQYTTQEMQDALTEIPSVMITTDIGNLVDVTTGIYSNPSGRGSAWERASHMEIIGTDVETPVSVRCGLRIRGGASRNKNNPKHSFRVFFDADYGDSRLENPIFGTEGVDEFKKIDFRTAQNYSWSKDGNKGSNTFLRDVLGRDLQAKSGQPYTRSRFYHLYLNGIYWGLFMSQERAEANWGESYLGGNDNDFDTLKSGGSSQGYDTEATDGNMGDDINTEIPWRKLWDLAKAQVSSPTTARYFEMQGLDSSGQPDATKPTLLDADNLIDYMLVIGYTGAFDNSLSDFVGASNNWYSVRDAVSDNRGFVHLLHDGEHSMGAGGGRWTRANDRINTTDGASDRNDFTKSNPQFLHMDLADSTPEYRLRFADRAHAALFNGGYLTKEKVLATLEKRKQVVDKVIIAESARWGDADSGNETDPADKADWEGAVEDLETTIETRTETFLGHLRLGNLYPDTDAPTFAPYESLVDPGTFINISAPEGTIYYTTDGSDPRLPDGSVNSSATAINSSASTVIFGLSSDWTFDDSGTDRGSSTIVAGEAGYGATNWKHPDFDDSGWADGPAILGYGQLGNTGLPIATPMGSGTGPGGANPITSYLRRDFNINGLPLIGALELSYLADDAVIIYINGKEVHRSNIQGGEVLSSTTATNAIGGNNESNYTDVTIDASALVEGDNIITVELHQVNATSSDLGFDLSLSSTPAEGVFITAPTYLSARALNNGEWSAIMTQYYSTGVIPQIGDLVISEIHYHPANPSTAAELAVSDSDSDFEFIELANITYKTLELKGTTLAEQVIGDHLEGVKFEFLDGYILEPGERVIIVANEEAFYARYPSTSPDVIAGEYQGNMGNSGEWLELRNVEDVILASFRYNDTDPWPTEADGDGTSLQLENLNGGVDYSDPEVWISVDADGSPGEAGPTPFSGPTDADVDRDGTVALIEYFTGTSDLSAASNYFPELSPVTGQASTMRYSFIRDPNAINITWQFQQTVDFLTWTEPTNEPILIERVIRPDGLFKETYDFDTTGINTNAFFRQKVELIE